MSFPLSLRSWPTRPKESDSLEVFIKRIHEERGHFRNVTEQSFQEEIEKHGDGNSDTEVTDDGETTQDVEARRKELHAARTEMLKRVGQAQNEALTLLDFISLLISKDAPKQADLSMSPFLKETIPSGTLAFDKVPAFKPSKVDDERAKGVARGWNFQSLNSAAERLLDSANRLGNEMEKEARYWEQVLSIGEKGWSICKIPREGNTIGVRFGFSEAAANFGARSLAALRPDNDGTIMLDRGLSNQAKSIRVRLARYGRVIGSSSLPPLHFDSKASLEQLIHQARDSLFEEELYQEMTREARTLISYGVQIIGSEIRFAAKTRKLGTGQAPVQSPLEVIIDQVSIGDVTERVLGNDDVGWLAEIFAIALRILLTNAYRHKFLARSQTPLPLSNDKRSAPIQEILRPLVAHFRHGEAIDSLHSFLKTMVQTLRSAQLDADFIIDQPDLKTGTRPMTSGANVRSFVAAFETCLTTTIKLKLPGHNSRVLGVSTRLAAPEFGTQFQLSPDSGGASLDESLRTNFHSLEEMHDQLVISIRKCIATLVATRNSAWIMEQSGYELRKNGASRIQRLKIGFQNERLFLLSETVGEAPIMLATWHGAFTDTPHESFADTVDKVSKL